MNGQTIPNNFATVSASAKLLTNYYQASLRPATAPIGAFTAYPMRGLLAAFVFGSVFIPASGRAINGFAAPAPLGTVPHLPRLEKKRLIATNASQFFGRFPLRVFSPHVAASLEAAGIGRVWNANGIEAGRVLHAQAFAGAKPLALPLGRWHQHFSSAVLTGLRFTCVFHSHKDTKEIRHFNGSGTTGLVALENGRQYVGIELNPEYAALTRKRLARVQVDLFRSQPEAVAQV